VNVLDILPQRLSLRALRNSNALPIFSFQLSVVGVVGVFRVLKAFKIFKVFRVLKVFKVLELIFNL
ncbi:MAG: hypothetical protein K2H72_05845, partial [Muribaculaceae bacterium]|nr:hypothetical protein [Muribaculaceae bacterium]